MNGKSVEFGVGLASSLLLPINSKWPAITLTKQISAAERLEDRMRLRKEIEKAILQKAREVSRSTEVGVTVPIAIAVIPDAVYQLSMGVHSEAFQSSAVLVSYSMFIPCLLLLVETTVNSLHTVVCQKLDVYLHAVHSSIDELQEELDGRFARAPTMLNNSRDEVRAHISKASGSITSLQLCAPACLPSLSETVE